MSIWVCVLMEIDRLFSLTLMMAYQNIQLKLGPCNLELRLTQVTHEPLFWFFAASYSRYVAGTCNI